MAVTQATITYSSSIDAITTLNALIAYPTSGTNLPVVAIMHGFGEAASGFDSTTRDRFANYGVMAVFVDMRGAGTSGGTRDVGGREVQDIVDAIKHVLATYPTETDDTQIHIVGYSGGGGNVYSCLSRFPDFFNTGTVFFGISDYGYNATSGWYQAGASGSFKTQMDTYIGGNPSTYPDRYHARDQRLAIANYTGGHLWIFHDDQDTSVPIVNTSSVASALAGAGLTNYSTNITTTSSSPRWLHALPNTGQPIINAESTFMPPMTAGTYTAWSVPTSGTLAILGWLDTKRFSLWLGTGTEEFGSIAYNVSTRTFTLTVETGPYLWALVLKNQTPSATITATINGVSHSAIANGGGNVLFNEGTEVRAPMTSVYFAVKNQAWTMPIKLFPQSGSTDWLASPTLASGDFKRTGYDASGAVTLATGNLTNLPAVLPLTSGNVPLLLTTTEMNNDIVMIDWKDAAGAEWQSGAIIVMTTANNVDSLLTQGTGTNQISLAAGLVTLADGSITAAKIAADTITAAKIADGAIDANTFAAGAINAAAIATDAIAGAKLAADAVAKIIAAMTAPATPANITAAQVAIIAAQPAPSAIVTALMAAVVEGSLTFQQVQRIMLAALAGRSTGGGTANPAFRDLANTKNRIAATVDGSGNRTAITLDGA